MVLKPLHEVPPVLHIMYVSLISLLIQLISSLDCKTWSVCVRDRDIQNVQCWGYFMERFENHCISSCHKMIALTNCSNSPQESLQKMQRYCSNRFFAILNFSWIFLKTCNIPYDSKKRGFIIHIKQLVMQSSGIYPQNVCEFRFVKWNYNSWNKQNWENSMLGCIFWSIKFLA